MRYATYIAMLLIAVFVVASPLAADKVNYRWVGNERYAIVEANTLYIDTRDVLRFKGALDRKYFFSVGPEG